MELTSGLTRRQVLGIIGKTAGVAAMYQAMTALGYAGESTEAATRFALHGAPKDTSILILGAGIAGMTAAYELKKAGYSVKILEYREKAGGRCWTLRGGDTFTELGGATQKCEFDPGLYFNPGPWRLPYNHYGILHYAKTFGVALEPFIQVNYNAYVHSNKAFGGKPVRYREVQADYQGYMAELLAKSINQGALDQEMTLQEREMVIASLKSWGALDDNYHYGKTISAAWRRGFEVNAGGGLMPPEAASQPLARRELIESAFWKRIITGQLVEFQSSIFQPVGGMDMIAQAFARQLPGTIRYNAKVTNIHQDERGVSVQYTDTVNGQALTEQADYLVCTIPASILAQIPMNVGAPMQAAIHSLPYGASSKVGLQFKRRFWEQDDFIYGGISYTDLPIRSISYPSTDYGHPGKGVLLGGYTWEGPNSYEFTAMTPAQRVQKAVEYGAQIHPQYKTEFDNGVAVGWHRVPWTQGCYGQWGDDEHLREQHYKNLCDIDGRIVLAGEHCSHIPAWQEGAVLSAQDAISRLHAKIVAQQ